MNANGLISFFASHHAIRAERVLARGGFRSQLVPGPRELSPNCGVALRFDYAHRDEALPLLAANKVQVDGVHVYTPRTDHFRGGGTAVDAARTFMVRVRKLRDAASGW